MKKIVCIIISILIGTTGYIILEEGSYKSIEKEDSYKNVEKYEYIKCEVKEEKIEPVFMYSEIPDDIKEIMNGKSMPKSASISFEELAYIKLTHYGFDGKTYNGEMVVDKRLAAEVVDIFKELYDKKYPIEKVQLIDEYNADDNLSMNDNNSSAFCYRTIKGTNTISNHGKGMAIDINPFQNPHVIGETTVPAEAFLYSDRTIGDIGIIREGDDCYNAFVKRGWTWGGHWNNPDYQHFEKVLD